MTAAMGYAIQGQDHYGQEAIDEMISAQRRHRTADLVQEKLDAIFFGTFEDEQKKSYRVVRGSSWAVAARAYIALFVVDNNFEGR